jgi:hypothetical protein
LTKITIQGGQPRSAATFPHWNQLIDRFQPRIPD